MAFLEAIPAIAEAAGPLLSRIAGSGVGSKVLQSVGTKAAAGAVGDAGAGAGEAGGGMGKNLAQGAAHLATSALNNIHPISNSGPVPGTQPMDQPGYNNLSQAQFQDSVQQQ